MDGGGTGYLKGKVTPRSAPGHPWLPVAPGVLSPELLGRLREVGKGLGTEGAQHSSCRDAGCGMTAGCMDNPALSGIILQPARKSSPRHRIQPRTPGSCQFEEEKGNWLLCSVELLGSLPF